MINVDPYFIPLTSDIQFKVVAEQGFSAGGGASTPDAATFREISGPSIGGAGCAP